MDDLLVVRDLSVDFPLRRGRRGAVVRAVRGVSLTVAAGRTLGVVGESGSGKTTLARAILGLVPASSGRVVVDGLEVGARTTKNLDLRRRIQVVRQNPTASLDPLRTVESAIGEALDVHAGVRGAARRARVEELLNLVGLDPVVADRRPRQLSGGQRQRVNIARAMAVRPKLLVLDEPISALDLATQSQILNLLERLQVEFGTSYVLIGHDLAAIQHASHDLAVMYLGQVVEWGDAEQVYMNLAHPYTQALIAATPIASPVAQSERRQRRRRLVRGELPSPIDPPSGCAFHTRCPIAVDVCGSMAPPVASLDGGRSVMCHRVDLAANVPVPVRSEPTWTDGAT